MCENVDNTFSALPSCICFRVYLHVGVDYTKTLKNEFESEWSNQQCFSTSRSLARGRESN